MTTSVKCRAVIFAIRDIVAEGGFVTFTHDWGRNSITVELPGKGHSHVGDPDFTDEQFVDSLYDLFVQGRGLSFVARHGLTKGGDGEVQ